MSVAVKAKPANGKRLKPDEKSAMRALLDSGRRPKDVARALGVSTGAVTYHVRKEGAMTVEVNLSGIQADKLRSAATRYGREPSELAASIISIVIADDLFAAVIG